MISKLFINSKAFHFIDNFRTADHRLHAHLTTFCVFDLFLICQQRIFR